MNICLICYSRVGGTSFGNWLSLELDKKYIHEPFNENHNEIYKDIDFNENRFVIKIEPHQVERIPNKKIIIGLIRENTFDCAISLFKATKTNRWHKEYQVNQNWIDSNINEIKKLESIIESQNNKIKNMKKDILITYEGIYITQNDINKIQDFFKIDSLKYVSNYLNPKLRYRNGKKVII